MPKYCPCGAEIVGRAVNARLCWDCVAQRNKDDAGRRTNENKKPSDKTKPTGRTCVFDVSKRMKRARLCGKRTGNKGANYFYCDGHAKAISEGIL